MHSAEDVDALLRQSERTRQTAATSMNDRSSRSHAIFQIVLRDLISKFGTPVITQFALQVALMGYSRYQHETFRVIRLSVVQPRSRHRRVNFRIISITLSFTTHPPSNNHQSEGV